MQNYLPTGNFRLPFVMLEFMKKAFFYQGCGVFIENSCKLLINRLLTAVDFNMSFLLYCSIVTFCCKLLQGLC